LLSTSCKNTCWTWWNKYLWKFGLRSSHLMKWSLKLCDCCNLEKRKFYQHDSSQYCRFYSFHHLQMYSLHLFNKKINLTAMNRVNNLALSVFWWNQCHYHKYTNMILEDQCKLRLDNRNKHSIHIHSHFLTYQNLWLLWQSLNCSFSVERQKENEKETWNWKTSIANTHYHTLLDCCFLLNKLSLYLSHGSELHWREIKEVQL
jgi:hypothetical protein